ncbi:hypothetical protein ABIE45_004399 [Methylobacterium sp. OAE515]|uniref:hypothetical protein n=1 Tax=Methylobacterium sp. OAE515 TaxID=2817895 RepID=UPI00178BB623
MPAILDPAPQLDRIALTGEDASTGPISKMSARALGTPALLVLEEIIRLHGYHGRMFGVTGNGTTDDTRALQNACTTVKALGGVADGTGKSWSFPALKLSGNIKVTAPILPTHAMEGVGLARLFTPDRTIAILDGRPASDPGKFGFTRLRLRDLNFQGGLHGVCVGNPNIDEGLFDILGCSFADTADYAVDAVQAYSTSLHLERPRFVRCNGDVRTETDITTIIGGWSQPLADNFTADRAVYCMNHTVNGQSRYFQRLTLIGWAGIPVLGQKADGSSGWIADTRWVDVRGSFAALGCRFGGEEGGLPICHHFTVANSDASGNADFGYARGGSIAIRDCWTYVGLAARPDAAAIVLRGEAPTSIVWEGNTGPLTSPIVLNPGGGRGIADPAAYFAAWRAATGKPDEKPFFDWRISDSNARAVAMVPDAFKPLVRGPVRLFP